MSTAFITLSEFQLIEKSGSWISVDCNGVDAAPVVPSGQAAGVEASSPTDGTLITIARDGKPAVSVRWTNGIVVDPALPTYQNPLPFLAYDYQPGLPTEVNWSAVLAGLNALGNGYEWKFTPFYSNFLTGDEYPPAFLPVPTKFEPSFFALGATVAIPIQARCVSYTNLVPWANVGVISGDDPVQEDKATVSVLCLSDYIGAFNFPVLVQSGRIGPGGVVAIANGAAPYGPPALTTDYGPTVLTPDGNGVITIPGGAPTSYGPESVEFNASTFGEVLSGGPYTVTATQNEVTPQFDGFFVWFDEGLAKGQSTPSKTLLWVYIPVRNGQAPPLGYGSSTIAGTAETLAGYDGPPYLARAASAAFCLRGPVGTVARYSKPRHAFWHLASDSRGRLVATLTTAFPPYAVQQVKYPTRSGSFITGFYPQLDINEAEMTAVYRRPDNQWVCAITNDQWTTLGVETVLFDQSGGLVTFAYDESTGSQIYVMSLRDDGLSWLSTPAAAANPGSLPQVAVIRRRDAQGNSLPFVKAAAATLAGTVWENVVFIDQPSGGTIGIQVLPQGTIVLVCGTEIYTSNDNGSNFYDQSSTLVSSLTNMASPPAGATGGTQNP